MKETTLCYITKGDYWLMLHRTKKQQDENGGKWIGVGGHIEAGETPEICVRREILEETGLTVHDLHYRGVVDFMSDVWKNERMHLFTTDEFEGQLIECDEGELKWVHRNDLLGLPMWEGDVCFLRKLWNDDPFFTMTLHYKGEKLVNVES